MGNDPVDVSHNIGEIKGLLQGIQSMMTAQSESMNRRMDDLHRSVTSRLDEHKAEIANVSTVAHSALTAAKTAQEAVVALRGEVSKKGGASGAGAGGIVAIGIELIKHLLP